MKMTRIDIETSSGRIYSSLQPIEEKSEWVESLKSLMSGDNSHLELAIDTRVVLIDRKHISSIEIDEVESDE